MAYMPLAPYSGVSALLGNTPLVELPRLAEVVARAAGGTGATSSPTPSTAPFRLWAKLEQFNPGGSAKDRTAAALVEAAIAQGLIDPTSPVTLVESSSGNLGIALARQALLHGWEFHCVVDPRVNSATIAMMEALGATVDKITSPDPETGDWLAARRARVQELLTDIPHAINLDQYSNRAAFTAHCDGTMTEILRDLGHAPDWLFVAMSTTGTIGGCLRKLADVGATTHSVGVDAFGSVLFGGTRATRLLPGFGAGVIPKLSEEVTPTEIMRIHDLDSVIGARVLARTEGILPGASGGAVVSALLQAAPAIDPGSDVVMVLHDGGANYLDTIYNDTWVEHNLDSSATLIERRVREVVG